MKCLNPITIKNPDKFGVPSLTVPCGKCAFCLATRRLEWFVRIKNEYKDCSSAFFVTYTYDEVSSESEYKFGKRIKKIYRVSDLKNLSKIDVQQYFKRLRQSIARAHKKRLTNDRNVSEYLGQLQDKVSQIASKCPNIKYYLVGEYGSNNSRPHYHAIVFNIDIALKHLIAECWPWGHVQVDQVSDATIMYVCKYVINSKEQNVDPSTGEVFVKSFSLISKSLGSGYVETHKKYHKETQNFFVTMEGGKKYRLPRYYQDKIFNKSEKLKHAKDSQKHLDEIEISRQEFLSSRGENPFTHELETNKQVINKIKDKSKSKKV